LVFKKRSLYFARRSFAQIRKPNSKLKKTMNNKIQSMEFKS
jgi:hypothetical protein